VAWCRIFQTDEEQRLVPGNVWHCDKTGVPKVVLTRIAKKSAATQLEGWKKRPALKKACYKPNHQFFVSHLLTTTRRCPTTCCLPFFVAILHLKRLRLRDALFGWSFWEFLVDVVGHLAYRQKFFISTNNIFFVLQRLIRPQAGRPGSKLHIRELVKSFKMSSREYRWYIRDTSNTIT
jgi:hypothetical protein